MHHAEHVIGTPTLEDGPHIILHVEIPSRWSYLLSQIRPCLPPLDRRTHALRGISWVASSPGMPRLGDFLEAGGGERHCTRWPGLSPMIHPRDIFLRYEHVHYILAGTGDRKGRQAELVYESNLSRTFHLPIYQFSFLSSLLPVLA
jgi:hypothetical protein